MKILGVLLGLACGVAGSAVVIGLFRKTSKEFAWLAWAIGFAVGCGARIGGGGWPAGLYAASVTVGALGVAKIVAIRGFADQFLAGIYAEVLRDKSTSFIARDVMAEHRERGEHLDWTKDATPVESVAKEHFPAEVWSQAEARFKALPEEGRAELEREGWRGVGKLSPKMTRIIYTIALMSNFNWIDAVFYSVASIVAYALGSGLVF